MNTCGVGNILCFNMKICIQEHTTHIQILVKLKNYKGILGVIGKKAFYKSDH